MIRFNFKKFPHHQHEHANAEYEIFRHYLDEAAKYLRSKRSLLSRIFTRRHKPLFIILGAESSGKTSLLVNSGLSLADVNERPIQNLLATRYCHFWFGDHLIVLDTAGSYTASDRVNESANLAWRSFIKLLLKKKSDYRFSGLIVAIDLPALSLDKERLQEILNNIRERIYEIANYSRGLPLYILLTKTDLIAGFTDFFADLNADERQQPFGISFVDGLATSKPIQVFNDYFYSLLQRLNQRVLWRLHQENRAERRLLIKEFPLQIESIQDTLKTIVNEMPSDGRLNLAGIYFISSLQHGKPIDYLGNILANNFHIASTLGAVSRSKNSQVYFLKDFWNKIALKRRNFSAPQDNSTELSATTKSLRKQFLMGASLLMLLCATVFSYSYYKNLQVIETLRSSNFLSKTHAGAAASASYLDKLNEQRAVVDIFKQGGVSGYFWRFFGSRSMARAVETNEAHYQNNLRDNFLPQLKQNLEQALVIQSGASSADVYGALKVYLLLGDKHSMDDIAIKNWFHNYWLSNNSVLTIKPEELIAHLNALLNEKMYLKVDDNIVANARAFLMQAPTKEVVYSVLQDLFATQALFDDRSDQTFLVAPIIISELYDASGIKLIYGGSFDKLIRSSLQDNWVLAQNLKETNHLSDVDLDQLVIATKDLYLQNYLAAWDQVLHEVIIKPFASVSDAAASLKVLASDDAIFLKAVRRVQKSGGDISAYDSSGSAAQHFSTLNNAEYEKFRAAIVNVGNYFATLAKQPDGKSVLAEAAKMMSGDNNAIPAISALRELAAQEPEPFKSWLNNLADNCVQVVLNQTHQYLNQVWQQTVLPAFNATLNNAYPFNPKAGNSAKLQDFAAFFAPQGIMDQFVNDYVKPFVDTSKSYWALKSFSGKTLDISQAGLESLMRAELIKNMFFGNGDKSVASGALPAKRFTLLAQTFAPGVQGLTMVVDGQTLIDTPESITAHRLVWPGPNPGKVALEFVNRSGARAHDEITDSWAWFRLLDKSNLQPTDDPHRYTIIFDLNGNAVKYWLITDTALNPFIPDILDNFSCAPTL